MNTPLHILGLSGSARTESHNLRLLRLVMGRLADQGHTVEQFDFRANPLPMYDGDDEAGTGLPENARLLKAKVKAADGVIIASPEYNAAISPLLKNAIDWTSRFDEQTKEGSPWGGKVVALVSASPGPMGGLRGLYVVRQVLHNLDAMVIPEQTSVGLAFEAFDEQGGLKDERTSGFLDATLSRFLEVARALRAATPASV